MVTGISLALVVPGLAWASGSGAADVAYEVARRRPRVGGFFGGLTTLCCLVVVAVVVLAIVLSMRKRR